MLSRHRWTLPASIVLVIAALIACKKKEEPPPPVVTPPPPAVVDAEAPKDASATTSDVKRYPDKEKDERGTVRVTYANAKVYKEADDTTDHISTLSLGTLVNRKARYGNWMLIDWPSGVGELSPGWILSKQLDDKTVDIDPEKVKNQDATVVIVAVPDAAAPPPTTTDAAAKVPDAGAAKKDGGRLSLPNPLKGLGTK